MTTKDPKTLAIDEAEAEAKRFLAKVKAWRAVQRKEKHGEHLFTVFTPKEAGAMRRASMDLTRALAAMRKA
jgi:hypothetical protein